jgi:signal transduction histidine kinase
VPFRRGNTIATRLARLTMLASGVALVTSSLALGIYDQYAYRQSLGRRLTWQADIVAANSASALVFDDPVAATITVGALSAVPGTVFAAIYKMDGRRFAEYHRADTPAPPAERTVDAGGPADVLPARVGDRLVLTRPILVHDKPVGLVSIEADLAELAARQRDYAMISGIILLASLGVAMLLSARWQRPIYAPIAGLAQVAGDIARDQDYRRRADAGSGVVEIDALAGTFNEMLDQIEARNRSLREAHDELEARVRARTAELQTVNGELEAFSYSVSHDLRAPLRHVSGFAELLSEHAGAALDDQARKYVATINNAARRMATLIDDLLGFSRVSRAALNRQRVSLTNAVERARREIMTDPTLGVRRITWTVAPLPEVDADPAMLHQVLLNLFANAVKYTAPRDEARIEVGTAPGGPDEAVVFIRDNGVGFDMQYIDKLFGVFQRLHRSSEFEGTGIGLANIKRIVTRHGGRVWAEGIVNAGATFYVALPLAKDAS